MLSLRALKRRRSGRGGDGGSGRKEPRTDFSSQRLAAKVINQVLGMVRQRLAAKSINQVLGMQLYRACEKGKMAEAKRLIAEGAPVDWQNSLGDAPLHVASSNGHLEIVMLLIENKCNTNIRNCIGDTPLIDAARNFDITIVRELVWSLCDTTIRGCENNTAAMLASKRFSRAIAQYLAGTRRANSAQRDQEQIRADPSHKEVLRKFYPGQKLFRACLNGWTAEVKELIEVGAPVDWQDKNGRLDDWQHAHGMAPLHAASLNNSVEIAKLLVETKCNVDIADENGNTPLILAACGGRMGTVLTEDRRGGRFRDRYMRRFGRRRRGCSDIVMFLVESKCDVNITDENGNTPLILAAHIGSMPVVRALVNAGADTTSRSKMAIMRYAWERRTEGMRITAEKTAAECATECDNQEIAEYLTTEAPLVRFGPVEQCLVETGFLREGPLTIIKEYVTGMR